jgi:thioredoxin 1
MDNRLQALYFTAPWCKPCVVFGPIMEKVNDILAVRKVDLEQDLALAGKYGVMSVPTVVFVDNEEKEAARFVGARTEDWVRDFASRIEV